VHRSLVSNWLSGTRGIDSENLLSVARVFGVTPAYIKGLTDERLGPPGLISERVKKMIEGYAANANVDPADFLEYIIENFAQPAVEKIKHPPIQGVSSAAADAGTALLHSQTKPSENPSR